MKCKIQNCRGCIYQNNDSVQINRMDVLMILLLISLFALMLCVGNGCDSTKIC